MKTSYGDLEDIHGELGNLLKKKVPNLKSFLPTIFDSNRPPSLVGKLRDHFVKVGQGDVWEDLTARFMQSRVDKIPDTVIESKGGAKAVAAAVFGNPNQRRFQRTVRQRDY